MKKADLFGVWLVFLATALWGELLAFTLIASQCSDFFAHPKGTMLRDFGFFWGAARLALTGEISVIFSPESFNSWLSTQLAPGSMEEFSTWSYPPTMLAVMMIFGILPASFALIAWDGALVIWLVKVVRRVFEDRQITLAVLLSPASVSSFLAGQNGPLTAGLLIFGIWKLDVQPWLAGACIGALVIKPQLALVLPAALVASKRWKPLAAATLASLGLVSVSLLAFGTGAWRDFLFETVPYMNRQLLHPYGIPPQFAMPTPFVTLQGWGLSSDQAMLAQGTISVLMIALVAWAWHRPGQKLRVIALTFGASLLATPYALTYDMIPITLAVVLVVREGIHSGELTLGDKVSCFSVWCLPYAVVPLSQTLHTRPMGAIILLIFVLQQAISISTSKSSIAC